ncbi:TolC family protein [Candidatus Uabimicrobium sp. HlEnr_7]|uniref:TolC family protein n=1 Tax=Candidatus Uabimicrobium helgolandensis TaxID=3095367 RepID=UPI00355658AF
MRVMLFITTLLFLCSLEAQQHVESVTIKDCLIQALRNNIELKVESYNPKLSEFDLTIAKSDFDPTFTSSFRYISSNRDAINDFSSNENVAGRFNIGLQKANTFGGTTSVSYQLNYDKDLTDNPFLAFNTSWSGTLAFSVTQPLLRNFGIGVNTTNIRSAENNVKSSYYAFQLQSLNLVTSVQQAYWDLINARENYELQRQSLRQTQNLYKITQARIKAGSLAAADILNAERNVAQVRDALILAEQQVLLAEDQLKRFIRPLDTRYYENVRLIPVERPYFSPIETNFEKSLGYALKHRQDLKQNLLAIENSTLSVSFQKNQLLPRLDLTGTLDFNGIDENHPEVVDVVVDGDFPSWSVQLELEIPIGNRAARARYQQAIMQRKQLELQHQQIQSQIIWDVRQAIRNLNIASRRVYTARKTRELAEKQLANEENKFRAGIIPLFQVQETEQDLTSARINEINTVIAYQKAIYALDQAEGALDRVLRKYSINVDPK